MTMEGDSSTTDASQLGVSTDYTGGSHYDTQHHDDPEDSMRNKWLKRKHQGTNYIPSNCKFG
jgi:hypothetical protein